MQISEQLRGKQADDTLPVIRQGEKRQRAIRRGDIAGLTDIGLVRATNEDQFIVADLDRWLNVRASSFALSSTDESGWIGGPQGTLLVVADGMGGHGHGDVASSVTVDALLQHILFGMPWFAMTEHHDTEVLEQLEKVPERCQQRVETVAQRKGRGHEKMGTTLTLAYVEWPTVYVAHVGDSRCYLHRDSHLRQITTDHTAANTYGQEFAGRLAERFQHVLVRAIGAGHQVPAPDLCQEQLQDGDDLLLCTDGLTNKVDDHEIASYLPTGRSALASCRELIDAAKNSGGEDNITVVLARY